MLRERWNQAILSFESNRRKRAESSDVKQQYGDRIEQVIRETLAAMGVESAYVSAVDKGALDCTVEARTQAAAYRAANSTDYKFTE